MSKNLDQAKAAFDKQLESEMTELYRRFARWADRNLEEDAVILPPEELGLDEEERKRQMRQVTQRHGQHVGQEGTPEGGSEPGYTHVPGSLPGEDEQQGTGKFWASAKVEAEMNRLTGILENSESDENVRLFLEAARGEIARAAQKVYDDWEQDEEGLDPELGTGGICDAIANEIGWRMANFGGIAVLTEGSDNHAWLVVYDDNEAYAVDIPASLYEEGGGYNWTKLPGIEFDESYVQIDPINYDDLKYAEGIDDEIYVERAEKPRFGILIIQSRWNKRKQAAGRKPPRPRIKQPRDLSDRLRGLPENEDDEPRDGVFVRPRGVLEIERHFGPGPHKGTGTPQSVHGGDGGGESAVDEGRRSPSRQIETPEQWNAGREDVTSRWKQGPRRAMAFGAFNHGDPNDEDRIADVFTLDEDGEIRAVFALGVTPATKTIKGRSHEFVELWNLATEKPGWGRRAMAEIATEASSRLMGVFLESTDDAQGFYEKLGMHRSGGTASHDPALYWWTADEAASFLVERHGKHIGQQGTPQGGSEPGYEHVPGSVPGEGEEEGIGRPPRRQHPSQAAGLWNPEDDNVISFGAKMSLDEEVDPEEAANFKTAAMKALQDFFFRIGIKPTGLIVTNSLIDMADELADDPEARLRGMDRWDLVWHLADSVETSDAAGMFEGNTVWMNDQTEGEIAVGTDKWERFLHHELGHWVHLNVLARGDQALYADVNRITPSDRYVEAALPDYGQAKVGVEYIADLFEAAASEHAIPSFNRYGLGRFTTKEVNDLATLRTLVRRAIDQRPDISRAGLPRGRRVLVFFPGGHEALGMAASEAENLPEGAVVLDPLLIPPREVTRSLDTFLMALKRLLR